MYAISIYYSYHYPSNPFTVCYPAVGVEIAYNLFGTFSVFD